MFFTEAAGYGLELLGKQDEEGVQQSPYDEIPRRTVPKSGEEPCNYRRNIYRELSAEAVGNLFARIFAQLQKPGGNGQRIEYIILEPCAHGDVPPAPVFGDIARKIRADEIFLYLHAEHLRNADGDIYAAGEIGVQLRCVQHGSDENICSRVGARIAAQRRYCDKEPVCNNELFEVAPEYALKTERYLLEVGPMLGKKRVLQIAEARNGSLDQQWEKRCKQRDAQYISLRLDLFPVYIYDIADGLEGVKRNAQRQHPVHRADRCSENGVDIRDYKICVFQRCENAEVDDQRQYEYPPAVLLAALFERPALIPLQRLALW